MRCGIKFGALVAILGLALACAQPLPAQSTPIQYYYDDAGRLVTVVDQSGNVVTYTYDATGNILSISRSTVQVGSLAIFDFNPETGPVLASVTIRGQGFSATASSDNVKFNGVTATVTSATTTSLVTSVPIGATTGSISVTVSGNTVTSSANFVVSQAPVITSVVPNAALFSITIPGVTVTGINLVGATFSFNAPTPSISGVSINANGTSATMTVSTGLVAGTYALVATTPAGSSTLGPTQGNRFTVVSPASTADTDGDGFPDVEEAAYGTDPLNPNSYPTGASLPLSGEVDAVFFSVLNNFAAQQSINNEADGVFFSVLNNFAAQSITNEADGVFFSVLNNFGSQLITSEADAVFFSVQNNAGAGPAKKESEMLSNLRAGNHVRTPGAPRADPASDQNVPENHQKKGEPHVR